MEERSLPAEKRCSTCRQWKPLDAFNRLRRARDGRQYNCRDCNSRYHQDNKARHNAQIRARSKRVRAELRELVRRHLTSNPCVDCGERDPVVLEFDHLRDKVANVSALLRWDNRRALVDEIAKCEVVCANCHRRRTYSRERSVRSFWNLRATDETDEPPSSPLA